MDKRQLKLKDAIIPITEVAKRTQKMPGHILLHYSTDYCNCQCGGCYGCDCNKHHVGFENE